MLYQASLWVALAAAGLGPDPSALQATDLRVNSYTSSAQEQVAVVALPGEEMMAVWQSRRQEHGSYGLFARRVDRALRPLGPEIHINQRTAGTQQEPALVRAPRSGQLLFAWQSSWPNTAGTAVVVRSFDPSFQSASAEQVVSKAQAFDPRFLTHDSGAAHTTTVLSGRCIM